MIHVMSKEESDSYYKIMDIWWNSLDWDMKNMIFTSMEPLLKKAYCKHETIDVIPGGQVCRSCRIFL